MREMKESFSFTHAFRKNKKSSFCDTIINNWSINILRLVLWEVRGEKIKEKVELHLEIEAVEVLYPCWLWYRINKPRENLNENKK